MVVSVMLCVQDSGMSLVSDQPAVQPAVYKALSRHLFFFSMCVTVIAESDVLHAGQWGASGQ